MFVGEIKSSKYPQKQGGHQIFNISGTNEARGLLFFFSLRTLPAELPSLSENVHPPCSSMSKVGRVVSFYNSVANTNINIKQNLFTTIFC